MAFKENGKVHGPKRELGVTGNYRSKYKHEWILILLSYKLLIIFNEASQNVKLIS